MAGLFIDRYDDLRIAIIEERMRCRPRKPVCYLGEREDIRSIIHTDAKTLELLGITHAEIARALEDLMSRPRPNVTVRILEQPLECPFELGTVFMHSNQEFVVRVAGEEIRFPGILMHMIAAHQFFGGRNSPYRLDPEKATRLLRPTDAPPPASQGTPA